ncbi:hypothetical protein NOM01_04355 [Sporolactobacillus sp. STSJ-5]|nr:hypothetical protein [Sporolactobacillus sp. STSJ-5]MCQ2009225.1 hypothetical protein [Sporolactobacillus sp. STSJ-5]
MRAIAAETLEKLASRKPQSKPFVWLCTPLMKGRDMKAFVRTAKENLKGG